MSFTTVFQNQCDVPACNNKCLFFKIKGRQMFVVHCFCRPSWCRDKIFVERGVSVFDVPHLKIEIIVERCRVFRAA